MGASFPVPPCNTKFSCVPAIPLFAAF